MIKHRIEVYPASMGEGWYWRARFIGKGPMHNRIVADGSEAYSSKSNAKRAARRIGRVLFFAPVVTLGSAFDG